MKSDESLPDTGDPSTSAVVRRAPFSSNPQVGSRGAQTHQRLLDAALRVFGEVGYHQTGIVRITEVAGCTRASFYQYFSNKDDAFRQLAADFGRELVDSATELEPVTPDEDGWKALRTWVDRHTTIARRYQAMFDVFQDAAEGNVEVAAGSLRIADRHLSIVRSKIRSSSLPRGRAAEEIVAMLLTCVIRSPRMAGVLRQSNTDPAVSVDRLNDSLADVVHRTLFGVMPGINARGTARRLRTPEAMPPTPVLDEVAGQPDDLTPTGARTREALVEAAQSVLVARGYHGTRVDDVTEAAGVSHGAFYRYFDNKDELVALVAGRALVHISSAFSQIPTILPVDSSEERAAADDALRHWLDHYVSTYASEAALVRVWLDATRDDPRLGRESAGALERGRTRMVQFLHPRGFGDVNADALILIVLLEVLTSPARPKALDAGLYVIERGLVGVDHPD